jgi:hypothetical protein
MNAPPVPDLLATICFASRQSSDLIADCNSKPGHAILWRLTTDSHFDPPFSFFSDGQESRSMKVADSRFQCYVIGNLEMRTIERNRFEGVQSGSGHKPDVWRGVMMMFLMIDQIQSV